MYDLTMQEKHNMDIAQRDAEIELLKKGSKVAHEAREICEAAYARAEKAHEKREAVYRAFVEAHDNVLETEDRWLYGKATYAEVCKSRDDRKEAREQLMGVLDGMD